MKLTEYFEKPCYLGFELKNIQEVLNAHALKLGIKTENDDYLDERYDEETDKNRPATTDEIISDALSVFKAGCKLYAMLDVPVGYTVVPWGTTTLYGNFYIGQKVYVMKNNKIIEDEIVNVTLSLEGKREVKNRYILRGNQGTYIEEKYIFATKEELVKHLMEEE